MFDKNAGIAFSDLEVSEIKPGVTSYKGLVSYCGEYAEIFSTQVEATGGGTCGYTPIPRNADTPNLNREAEDNLFIAFDFAVEKFIKENEKPSISIGAFNPNPKANDCYQTDYGAFISIYEDEPGVFAFNIYDMFGEIEGYASGFKGPDIEKDGIREAIEKELGEKITRFLGNYENISICLKDTGLGATDFDDLFYEDETTEFESLVEEAQNSTPVKNLNESLKDTPEI